MSSTHTAYCTRAEEWAEETGFAADGEPAEGVPWHAVVLIVAGLALLAALEIGLAFGVAKLVTGHAYQKPRAPQR